MKCELQVIFVRNNQGETKAGDQRKTLDFLFDEIAGHPLLSILVHHGRHRLNSGFLVLEGRFKLDDHILSIGSSWQRGLIALAFHLS